MFLISFSISRAEVHAGKLAKQPQWLLDAN